MDAKLNLVCTHSSALNLVLNLVHTILLNLVLNLDTHTVRCIIEYHVLPRTTSTKFKFSTRVSTADSSVYQGFFL